MRKSQFVRKLNDAVLYYAELGKYRPDINLGERLLTAARNARLDVRGVTGDGYVAEAMVTLSELKLTDVRAMITVVAQIEQAWEHYSQLVETRAAA
jgi:hypothetical protein